MLLKVVIFKDYHFEMFKPSMSSKFKVMKHTGYFNDLRAPLIEFTIHQKFKF